MVVYSVYADNLLIHHSESSSPEVKLINPKLSMEENSSGSFSCTIPPSNVGYDYVTRLTTEIIVKRQTIDSQTGLLGVEKEIWSGRVIDEKTDFYNNRQITCEGALSYLNDTIQPQAKYENYTPENMLRALLNNHNDRKTPYAKNGISIKFNYECKTETSFDYLRIYYINATTNSYDYIQLTGEFRDSEVKIPTTNFYLFWHTDSSVHDGYGYKIDSIIPYIGDEYTPRTSYSYALPAYTVINVTLNNLPESAHNPYQDNTNELYLIQTGFNRGFDQDIKLGAVTVHDPDTQVGSTTYETNFESTMDCVNNKLLNTCGGHLVLRRNTSDGYNYVDYLEEYSNLNNQKIEFGKNLLDFSKSFDVSSICTVLIPLGERLEGEVDDDMDSYLTVESVNSGSMYVVNQDAVNNFGWIEKCVHFDDVEDASILLRKAQRYLQDTQFEQLTLELTAVDMHYLGVDEGQLFELYDNVRCISKPHGLDRTFPIKKVDIPLDNPQNTTFTIGDNTVTNTLSSTLTASNTMINSKIDALPSTTSVLKEAKANADQLMRQLSNGYITTIIEGTEENAHSEAQVISNAQNLYEDATQFWIWNINGLAHYTGTWAQYKAGIGQLDTAITMDGTIVANRILTGTLGKPEWGNYWDMESGILYLGLNAYVGDDTSPTNRVASTGNISSAINIYDSSLDDKEVFDKLTRNGEVQGFARVYNPTTRDYQLYINASYINAGTMSANYIEGGVIKSLNKTMKIDLNNNEIECKKLKVTADNLKIDSNSVQSISGNCKSELTSGSLGFYYNNTDAGSLYASFWEGSNDLTLNARNTLYLSAPKIVINGVNTDSQDSSNYTWLRTSDGGVIGMGFQHGFFTGIYTHTYGGGYSGDMVHNIWSSGWIRIKNVDWEDSDGNSGHGWVDIDRMSWDYRYVTQGSVREQS